MESKINIIIVLLVANIVLSVLTITSTTLSKTTSGEQSNASAAKEAQKITEGEITAQFQYLKDSFNSGDSEKQWDIFGPYAKSQMNKDQTIKGIDTLFKMCGPITEGKYLYHEYLNSQGNLRFYTAYFELELTEKSSLGPNGTLSIVIAKSDKRNQVVRFNISSN